MNTVNTQNTDCFYKLEEGPINCTEKKILNEFLHNVREVEIK